MRQRRRVISSPAATPRESEPGQQCSTESAIQSGWRTVSEQTGNQESWIEHITFRRANCPAAISGRAAWITLHPETRNQELISIAASSQPGPRRRRIIQRVKLPLPLKALVSDQGLPWVCGPGKAIAACKVARILHDRRAVPPFQGWILDGGTVNPGKCLGWKQAPFRGPPGADPVIITQPRLATSPGTRIQPIITALALHRSPQSPSRRIQFVQVLQLIPNEVSGQALPAIFDSPRIRPGRDTVLGDLTLNVDQFNVRHL